MSQETQATPTNIADDENKSRHPRISNIRSNKRFTFA